MRCSRRSSVGGLTNISRTAAQRRFHIQPDHEGVRRVPMSAIGPWQTWITAPHMSAFGGRADMPVCTANVCL
jgi:hypothetical protein